MPPTEIYYLTFIVLNLFLINFKTENFIPLFRPFRKFRPDSGNSGHSGRNKTVQKTKFFMTRSVPVFGTDRNIPAVPAGMERNLKLCQAVRKAYLATDSTQLFLRQLQYSTPSICLCFDGPIYFHFVTLNLQILLECSDISIEPI